MAERVRSASYSYYGEPKSPSGDDFSPKKTILVLVVVVGCFAVLWPKLFYPMLVANANNQIKPGPIDKTTGCCDVIYETDLDTIRIMSELCKSIISSKTEPTTSQEIVSQCQKAVLETCGIDISAVLQEKVGLGHSVKQILDEVRSLNSSLCLKHHFGVSPWRLGVPHRVTLNMGSSSIRQERPQHLRPEMVHPAFRERGRAIPQAEATVNRRTNSPPRIVEGRPGPIPGMRPTIGGAGHVVPSKQQTNGVMGLLMPIYTIGFLIFFSYTIMKLAFKKKADAHQGESLYASCETNEDFRKQVFESAQNYYNQRSHTNNSKIVVNAVSAILEEVDQEIQARKSKSRETLNEQNEENSDSSLVAKQNEEGPSVTIMGMETTASCEGGKKWQSPTSTIPNRQPPSQEEPVPLPQQIFLETALPAQSQILVADSATETENNLDNNAAVILAGKMTLSVISFDSENSNEDSASAKKEYFDEERRTSSSNTSDEFEKVDASQLEDQIDNIIEEAQAIAAVETFDENDDLDQLNEDMKENLEKIEDMKQKIIDEIRATEIEASEEKAKNYEAKQNANENVKQQDVIEEMIAIPAVEKFGTNKKLNKLNEEVIHLNKIEDVKHDIIEKILATDAVETFDPRVNKISEEIKQNLDKTEDGKQQILKEIRAAPAVEKFDRSEELDKINEGTKQNLIEPEDLKQEDVAEEIQPIKVDKSAEVNKVNEEINLDRIDKIKQDAIEKIGNTEAVETFDASEELDKTNEEIKQHLNKIKDVKQQDVIEGIKKQPNLKDDLLGDFFDGKLESIVIEDKPNLEQGVQEFTLLKGNSNDNAKEVDELPLSGQDSKNNLKSKDKQLTELTELRQDINESEIKCKNLNLVTDMADVSFSRQLELINKELELLSEKFEKQKDVSSIEALDSQTDNISADEKKITKTSSIVDQTLKRVGNDNIDAGQSHLSERQSNDDNITSKLLQEQVAKSDNSKSDSDLTDARVAEQFDGATKEVNLLETYQEDLDADYDSEVENVVDDVEYVDESDDEEIDDEIRNLEVFEQTFDRIPNGNLDESKNGIVEANDISDSRSESEQADEDDEEIEEIIEYVDNTDEEGEEIIEIPNNGVRQNRENETN